MITLQHSALYFLAFSLRRRQFASSLETSNSFDISTSNDVSFIQDLQKEIPFLLLPDAIRAFSGGRQPSHFEQLPDGTDYSWMIFPDEETLKSLTKENFSEKVEFSIPGAYPKCAIGEETQIAEFDVRNWDHKHYPTLRCHLIQDFYMDILVREKLIDVTGRFKDKFIVLHNGQEIDGAEFRRQVTLLEKFGLLHLAGVVYKKTGFLLNQDWFDKIVKPAIYEAYSEELAESTYKYMHIDEEINKRICNKQFKLTPQECESVYICKDLMNSLNMMYSVALRDTFLEL